MYDVATNAAAVSRNTALPRLHAHALPFQGHCGQGKAQAAGATRAHHQAPADKAGTASSSAHKVSSANAFSQCRSYTRLTAPCHYCNIVAGTCTAIPAVTQAVAKTVAMACSMIVGVAISNTAGQEASIHRQQLSIVRAWLTSLAAGLQLQ